MDKRVKSLHEKIADVYNTMWASYKEYLDDGSARHINNAADRLEKKYQDDETVKQFVWYQRASWAGIVDQVREWSHEKKIK